MSKYGGYQNYSSYRGRSPKWKGVVAALLIIIILLSASVIWVQHYLVYDSQGRLHLENPWKESAAETLPEPELTIEEPEPEPVVRRAFLPGSPTQLTEESLASLSAAKERGEVDGAALMLRAKGETYFTTRAALFEAMRGTEEGDAALHSLLEQQTGLTVFFGCFQDPIAAGGDVEGMGLQNTGHYLFYDGSNHNWLDPGKEKTRRYLIGQMLDCAALGANEIVLQEFSYPTRGKLHKIAYPESGPAAALAEFLREARKALTEAGYEETRLCVELPKETILTGVDEKAGVDVQAVTALTDGVYCRCTAEEIPQLEETLRSFGGERFVPVLETMDPAIQERAEYVLLSLDQPA